MSQTSQVSNQVPPARRSTRINHAVPVTVMGVDSCRGPYREQVSTLSISAHGCKYESKHQVLDSALVILEVNGDKPDAPARAARGRVKYVKRLNDNGGLFQTAIEFEDPGNIWGIDSPPKDWLPYAGPRNIEIDTSKSKPFAVPRPEQSAPAAAPAAASPSTGNGAKLAAKQPAQTPATPPVGMLMGQFQQQMEKMLSDAAAVAVRERTSSALLELRAALLEDGKRILADAASSQAAPWIKQSLEQFKSASQEAANTLHAQWTQKIEAELNKSVGRIESRSRELDEVGQSFVTSTTERLQRTLEAARRDSVDRIIARLKTQLSPLLDDAHKATAALLKQKEDLEKLFSQSQAKSVARIEETCTRFEERFEKAIKEQLNSARTELERSGQVAAAKALENLQVAAQGQEAQAQSRLQKALDPVTKAALKKLDDEAAETAREFTSELKQYSKRHLEFVGEAISELAKGLGKISKD